MEVIYLYKGREAASECSSEFWEHKNPEVLPLYLDQSSKKKVLGVAQHYSKVRVQSGFSSPANDVTPFFMHILHGQHFTLSVLQKVHEKYAL